MFKSANVLSALIASVLAVVNFCSPCSAFSLVEMLLIALSTKVLSSTGSAVLLIIVCPIVMESL